MALTDAFPGASSTVDSTELRKNLAGLIVRDTAGNPRGGIFPRHANALVTSRSDMKLDIGAFEGASIRGGGPLFIANDGIAQSQLLPIPGANSQISVLYFKQNESASPYSDADNLPIYGVVTGAASATPAKPALTVPGAEELATITVPSTATATNSAGVVITPTHRFTTTAGGVILFRTTAERDLYLTAAPGQIAYSLNEKTEGVWDGSRWRALGPFAQAVGSLSGAVGTQVVTFPAGRFTLAPLVSVTALAPGLGMVTTVSGISATQMTVAFSNSSGYVNGQSFHWQATQATAISAAG